MGDENAQHLTSVPSMADGLEQHYNNKDPVEDQEPKLATVKMVLQSIGQTVTVAFPLRAQIRELLSHFAKELRMSESILQIVHKGRFIEELLLKFISKPVVFIFSLEETILDIQKTLSDYDVEPNTTVSMGSSKFLFLK